MAKKRKADFWDSREARLIAVRLARFGVLPEPVVRGLVKNTMAQRAIDHGVALRRGTVNLAAMTTPDRKSQISSSVIRLEAKLVSGEFSVDRAGAGALRNVSIISAGPAIGHGFIVDDAMLQQVADAINNSPNGFKVRLGHPWLEDGVFYRLGRAVKGARVETTANGNKVRGDIVFGKYAAKSPKGGDLAGYVMDLADEDPAELGVSISFEPDQYEERLDPATGEPIAPAGRIKKLLAVDIVDDPAANPDGLLSRTRDSGQLTMDNAVTPPVSTVHCQLPTTTNQPGREHGRSGITNEQGESDMNLNIRQRAYLTSCGLATDATDEQIKTFITELKAGQVKYLTSLQSTDEDKTPATPATPTPPAEPAKGDTDDADKAAEKALSGDRQRRKDILALAIGDKPAVSLDAAQQWADDGVSLADARRLAELAKTLTPIPTGRVEGGTDRNLATIAEGISDALLLRADWGGHAKPLMTFDRYTGQAERDAEGRIIARKPGPRAEQMRRHSVPELAKHYLAAVGVSGNNLSAMSGGQVLELASCRRDQFGQRLREAGGSVDLAMSTSDFPYILADAMGKVFLGGYNLAPSTGQLWTRRMTARDFKDVKLLNLSDAPALQSRAEGQGISFGTMSESREVVALAEYSSGLIWTRRAQINDDLGVLRDGGAMALGAMARYKEDDVVYAILTANAALADGIALFYATHGNISSGASTAVYAAAAPGVHPTIVQLFLESEQAPVMKQEVLWDTDDLKVAVRHSVAAKAADYRGLYKDLTGNATVASLALIVQAMAIQTAPGGAFLNLRPTFILCPAGVSQVTWSQLVGCSVDPAKNNATNNPFFNQLTVIGEPRLN